MLLIVIFLQFLASGTTIQKQPECQNIDRTIRNLRNYVACQSSFLLDSCAGIATEYNGRKRLTQGVKKPYSGFSKFDREALIKDLAIKLHQADKEVLENPKEELALYKKHADTIRKYLAGDLSLKSEVDDIPHFDPNSSRQDQLDDLQFYEKKHEWLALAIAKAKPGEPVYQIATWQEKHFRADGSKILKPKRGDWTDLTNTPLYSQPYNARYNWISQATELINQMFSDPSFSVENAALMVAQKASTEVADETLSTAREKALQQAAERQTVVIRQAFEKIAPKVVRGTAERASTSSAWAAMAALGSRAPLVAGGFVTGGIAAIDFAASATPVGCQEVGDNLMNLNEQCRPVYQIDARVKNFLDAEYDVYSDPFPARVCKYYTELEKRLFQSPKFSSLKCEFNGFRLSVRDENGKTQNLHAIYHSKTTQLRQITYMGKPIELSDDGKMKRAESQHLAPIVVPLKMYIMDAYDCCNAASPQEGASCLAAYNPGAFDDSGVIQ